MQLGFTAADRAFRAEIRAWLNAALPPEISIKQRDNFEVSHAESCRWQAILHEKGWAAPEWPVAHGGCNWTPVQRLIYEIEYAMADAPDTSVIGLHLAGPVLIRFGSPALQQRFLPGILDGSLHFCQGFSEPGAGSDLGGLATSLVRDGNELVVTGQKTWTSHAQNATHMIALVRSAPGKPASSLSMVILPMDAPGVQVRQIETVDDRHTLNEVFLDKVRIPADQLVGEENGAWPYTKYLLDTERTYNAHVGRLQRYLERLREVASAQRSLTGEPLLTDALEDRLARLGIDVSALQWFALRAMSDEGQQLGAVASALKIRGSELLLSISELFVSTLGPCAVTAFAPEAWRPDNARPASAPAGAVGLMAQTIYWRAASVFGGSNDIQRSIIWAAEARRR